MRRACEWRVCVSHDGLLTSLGCISTSRFFNFHLNIFLGQVSSLSIPLRRLVFWAFTQGDQLQRWKLKQGESPLRLWFEKSDQHSVLKLCHFRGRVRKNNTADRRLTHKKTARLMFVQDFTSARLLSEWRWSLWNVFSAASEESTPLEAKFQLKCPKL